MHTCGVRTDGTVACWGSNSYGQATPPAGTFSQVSAGGYHTCGVKTDATLACWGYNDFGQATPPAGTFTDVSAGDEYLLRCEDRRCCTLLGIGVCRPRRRRRHEYFNTGGAPDLIVYNIYSGQDPYHSCYVPPVVEVVIENVGTQPAAPSQVEVSTSGKTGYGDVSALSPGQFAYVDVYIQDATSGDFTATADVYHVVDESDESNNSLTKWVDLATQGLWCTPTMAPSPTVTRHPRPWARPATWTVTACPINVDNCPNVSNPDQLNTDAKPIDIGPVIAGYDYTVPNSDLLGDVCDPDIDNDYMLNTGTNQTLGIPGEDVGCGSGPTNPKLMDSDGDTVVDGYECLVGTDPNNPLSKPSFNFRDR